MNNLTRAIVALIMIASSSGAQNTLNIEYSSDNRLMKNVTTMEKIGQFGLVLLPLRIA